MPISNRSLFAAVLAACFGLTVFATLADVEVWTDKERVSLKGDLKGMRVLPPGSTGKGRPTGAKRPKAKPRVASRAPRTLRVGPGEEFKLPSQAAAFAVDGDTIEIKAGEYVDCATWRRNNLTTRGVGGRAHVKDKVCSGKISGT